MDAFSYTDIFDTKGIEYLIVIAFLMLIIPTWIWLNKPLKAKQGLYSGVRGISFDSLKIPGGVLFDRNHTWTFMERRGTAKVGIDDLLLNITGGVNVDYFINPGESIKKGEVVASLCHGDKSLEVASPVSGRLRSVNDKLKSPEGLINKDPYGKGWLCRIDPENWKEETASCLMADEAEKWAKEELDRVKEFFATFGKTVKSEDLPPVVMQAGGELSQAVLADMPHEIWRKFQSEILD